MGQGSAEGATIIGLYALDAQVPVALEKMTGHRAYLNIYADGTIGLDVSEGASYHRNEYYRMDASGCALELLQEFYTNDNTADVEQVIAARRAYEEQLTLIEDWNWQPLIG